MIKWLCKTSILVIITLVTLIAVKSDDKIKNYVYDYVYNDNISFAYIGKIYKKYFGNNDLLDSKIKAKTVFNEKLMYDNKENYKDGVKLIVSSNYLVPCLEEGLIIFTGSKEGYGNVVIISQIDGIDVWYGNLDNINVKLYDYVSKGSLIGNCSNELYLVFKKDGKIINYENKI